MVKSRHVYQAALRKEHVWHPYSSIDTTAAWKKMRFILSVRFDFHMTDSLSIIVQAGADTCALARVCVCACFIKHSREIAFSYFMVNLFKIRMSYLTTEWNELKCTIFFPSTFIHMLDLSMMERTVK